MNFLGPVFRSFLPTTPCLLPGQPIGRELDRTAAVNASHFNPSDGTARLLGYARPFALAFTLLAGCHPSTPPIQTAPVACDLPPRSQPKDLDLEDGPSMLFTVLGGREETRLVLHDLESVEDLLEPVNGSYPVRFRLLRDPEFHRIPKADPDTVHWYAYAYVPPSAGLSAENIISVLHYAENYPKISPEYSKAGLLASTSDERLVGLEIDTGISRERFAIRTPKRPMRRLPSNVLFTGWTTHSESTDFFLLYMGSWMVLPVRRGGHLIVQGMLLNTRQTVDNDPILLRAARETTVRFLTRAMEAAIDRKDPLALELPGGTPPKYAVGSVIDEHGSKL
jgi:hypothetical protein